MAYSKKINTFIVIDKLSKHTSQIGFILRWKTLLRKLYFWPDLSHYILQTCT